MYKHINRTALNDQVTMMIDQVFIREALSRQNLVAFVANGSILPRKSGVSDMPLAGAVTFQSPQEFEIQLNLPSGKTVSGMGIPKGLRSLLVVDSTVNQHY